jgi:site-specific recombinase XerD
MTSDFLANQRSENTRSSYMRALDRYFGWCKQQGITPAAITLNQAIRYRDEVEKEYAASTAALHVSAIKALYKMMHDVGYITLNRWAAVKGPKAPTVSKTEALGTDQVREIYAQAEKEGLRDLLVVRLLYEVPLRREEVADLPKASLRHRGDEGWLLLVKGKGDKTAEVGITDDLAHAITTQIAAVEGPWIFPGREAGEHLNKRQINRIADKYGFHPHQLRHSFVTNSIKQGIELPDISRTVRHSKITTTMRYFDQRETVRRSASRRLAPVVVKQLEPKE